MPVNTLVEMVFEMPEEISGQKNSTVLCQGRIIRRKDERNKELIGLAASILDYKFSASELIRERELPRTLRPGLA